MTQYAVAWRNEGEPVQSGRLDVEARAVRFEGGRHRSGRLAVTRVLYRDLLEVEMAPVAKRVQARPTIELRGRHGSIYVAPVGAALARELLGSLQLHLHAEAS